MRFYKLRAIPNGSEQAASYNAKVVPEIIPERNDAYKVDWLDPSSDTPILIGSQVRSLCFQMNLHGVNSTASLLGFPHSRPGHFTLLSPMANTRQQIQQP
jgi:hypothetical protein